MNLVCHYRTLGLRQGASLPEVKQAYRQLVRQYHPDVNPDKQAIERFIRVNDAYTAIVDAWGGAHRFALGAEEAAGADRSAASNNRASVSSGPLDLSDLTLEGLKRQLDKLGIGRFAQPNSSSEKAEFNDTGLFPWSNSPPDNNSLKREERPCSAGRSANPSIDPCLEPLVSSEASLKQEAYRQLRALLKQHKFPRAIALVEGLANRMPADIEISQWQAIVYQRWGRYLIAQGQFHKARLYLKKALATDPDNLSLWREVNRDFWQLANLEAFGAVKGSLSY